MHGMVLLMFRYFGFRIVLQGQELLTSNMMVSTSATLSSDNVAVFSRIFRLPYSFQRVFICQNSVHHPESVEIANLLLEVEIPSPFLEGGLPRREKQADRSLALAMIDLPHGCDQRCHSVVEYPSELARRYVRLVSSPIHGILRLLPFFPSQSYPLFIIYLSFTLSSSVRCSLGLPPETPLLIDRPDIDVDTDLYSLCI